MNWQESAEETAINTIINRFSNTVPEIFDSRTFKVSISLTSIHRSIIIILIWTDTFYLPTVKFLNQKSTLSSSIMEMLIKPTLKCGNLSRFKTSPKVKIFVLFDDSFRFNNKYYFEVHISRTIGVEYSNQRNTFLWEEFLFSGEIALTLKWSLLNWSLPQNSTATQLASCSSSSNSKHALVMITIWLIIRRYLGRARWESLISNNFA